MKLEKCALFDNSILTFQKYHPAEPEPRPEQNRYFGKCGEHFLAKAASWFGLCHSFNSEVGFFH